MAPALAQSQSGNGAAHLTQPDPVPMAASGRWVALGLVPPPSSRRLWESGAIGLYYALAAMPAGGRWLPGLLELPGLGLGLALAAHVPMSAEQIDGWLDDLAQEGLIALDRAAGLVYLPALVPYGVPRNINAVRAIARQWQRVKGSRLAQRAARELVAAAERAEPGREQRRRGQMGPKQPILDRLKQALGLALSVVEEPAQAELAIPTPAVRPRLRVMQFAGPDHRLDMPPRAAGFVAGQHAEKSQASEGDAVQRLNHGTSHREAPMTQHTLPLGGAAAGDKSAAPSGGSGDEDADEEVIELQGVRITVPKTTGGVGPQSWHSLQSAQGQAAGSERGRASADRLGVGGVGRIPEGGDRRRAECSSDAQAQAAQLSARLPARGFAAAWLAAAERCAALRPTRPALTSTGLPGDVEGRLARWWVENPQYLADDLLTLADWLNAGGGHTLTFGGKSVVASLCDGKLAGALDSALAWAERGRPQMAGGRERRHGIMVYDGGGR